MASHFRLLMLVCMWASIQQGYAVTIVVRSFLDELLLAPPILDLGFPIDESTFLIEDDPNGILPDFEDVTINDINGEIAISFDPQGVGEARIRLADQTLDGDQVAIKLVIVERPFDDSDICRPPKSFSVNTNINAIIEAPEVEGYDDLVIAEELPEGISFVEFNGDYALTGVSTEESRQQIIIKATGDSVPELLYQIFFLEFDEDDCEKSTNRCLNGGTCVDTVPFDGRALCDCPDNFKGPKCGDEQDEDDEGDPEANASRTSATEQLVYNILIGVGVLVVLLGGFLWYRRKRRHRRLKKALTQFKFPPEDAWEYNREKLQMSDTVLGEGQFGIVRKATATNIRGFHLIDVAVKQCSGEEVTVEELREFIKEANIMKRLKHPNIVSLLGVCFQQEPLLIITELADSDLKHALRKRFHDKDFLETTELGKMMLDLSCGVAYLHSLNIIHRDLACRNCLVYDDGSVKLSDLGFGRDTAYKDYYRLNHTAMLPVRWMAPEALRIGEFTKSTDIWALGVTFWEMAAYCEVPYSSMDNSDVMEYVKSGKQLKKPLGCPDELFAVMRSCWGLTAQSRPAGSDVAHSLGEVLSIVPNTPLAANFGEQAFSEIEDEKEGYFEVIGDRQVVESGNILKPLAGEKSTLSTVASIRSVNLRLFAASDSDQGYIPISPSTQSLHSTASTQPLREVDGYIPLSPGGNQGSGPIYTQLPGFVQDHEPSIVELKSGIPPPTSSVMTLDRHGGYVPLAPNAISNNQQLLYAPIPGQVSSNEVLYVVLAR